MAIINRLVQSQLDAHRVRTFFVSGQVTKWYNAQRQDKATEVCLLGGWYWLYGTEEHGPFRTPSAAQRDAYYRLILKQRAPALDDTQVRQAEAEIQEKAKKLRDEAEKARRRTKKRDRVRA
jgi:hypothetical protein